MLTDCFRAAVIHNAAHVNHALPYRFARLPTFTAAALLSFGSALKSANVGSCLELLKLCNADADSAPVPFIFVSSASSCDVDGTPQRVGVAQSLPRRSYRSANASANTRNFERLRANQVRCRGDSIPRFCPISLLAISCSDWSSKRARCTKCRL